MAVDQSLTTIAGISLYAQRFHRIRRQIGPSLTGDCGGSTSRTRATELQPVMFWDFLKSKDDISPTMRLFDTVLSGTFRLKLIAYSADVYSGVPPLVRNLMVDFRTFKITRNGVVSETKCTNWKYRIISCSTSFNLIF